jgi:hypothetical protein
MQSLISLVFHPSVWPWDLCSSVFSLFGPKKKAYLSQVLSDTFCPLHEYAKHMLNAAGVWPDCRLETNVFCWTIQSEAVGRQHGSPIGFSVAADVNSNVVVLPCLETVKTVVLCRLWLHCCLTRGSAASRLLWWRICRGMDVCHFCVLCVIR